MERMRHNPGDREPVLAVPETTVTAEAREQTPTLMAGESAGSQGAVQVWASERWRLLPRAIVWTLPVLFLLRDMILGPIEPAFSRVLADLCGLAILTCMPVRAAYGSLLRPCHLTADHESIGIRIAGGGDIVVRWSDIDSMRREGNGFTLYFLPRSSWVFIPLNGYSRRARKALKALIIARAELIHVERSADCEIHWYSTKNAAWRTTLPDAAIGPTLEHSPSLTPGAGSRIE